MLLLGLAVYIKFELWEDYWVFPVCFEPSDLDQNITGEALCLNRWLKFLIVEVALDSNGQVTPIDPICVIRAIQDGNDRLSHLVKSLLVCVKTVLYHEKHYFEHLFGHGDLVDIFKPHRAILIS